jgi:hypothetical protein
MKLTRSIVCLTAAALLAACGQTALDRPEKGAEPGLLFVEDGSGITAFDPSSGATTWSAQDVLASPGLERVFRVVPISNGARLIAMDPADGGEVSGMEVPQGFIPRVASGSGESVALVLGGMSSVYEPVARDHTTILVARPGDGTIKRFELRGNFEPEAFSTDDRELFMIQYLNDDLTRYSVRMMRISTGKVMPIGRLTKAAPVAMRGIGRTQVYSPDGETLYTLYTKQPPNVAHRDISDIHNRNQVHAFVHMLNLSEGWAHCIDLPMPFGLNTDPASMLAISPDGTRLYAGDGQRIALVTTPDQSVEWVKETSETTASAEALVGPDGRLFVGDGSVIRIFDGGTLDEIGSFDAPAGVGALGLSADGLQLFVGGGSEVFVIDSETGRQVGTLTAPGADRLLFTALSR